MQFCAISCIFCAVWNLIGKANKTDPIRPLLPATGLEGARAPRLDPPLQPHLPFPGQICARYEYNRLRKEIESNALTYN